MRKERLLMRVTVCGTRGSTPALGQEFVRYGGHTSCVVLAHDGQPPSLILDGGTGIRSVSGLLGGRPFQGALVLGHLHWDHTQGIPFFAAGDHPSSHVDLYVPAQGDTEAVVSGFMSPPYFPISPKELRGSWRFEALEPGEAEIAGFRVLALEIPHKGGRTYGFRVSDGSSTVAYLSDHCPTNIGSGPDGLGARHRAAVSLADGCDLLLHDAQYTDEELPARARFGHSSCGYAVGLAQESQSRRLLLYHHDPLRTDDEIDAMVAKYQSASIPVSAAVQDSVIELG